MKIIDKKIFLIFLLFFLQINFTVKAGNLTNNTRFVVAGHLYPIIEDVERLNKFADKVNSYKPDYIFILGDSGLQDKKNFNKISH